MTSLSSPLLSNRVYDILKYVVTIVLPAIGTFYFTVSEIWSLDFGPQVLATVTALSLLGGTLLGISTKTYNKSDAKYDGEIVMNTHDPDKEIYTLSIDQLAGLGDKKDIALKVRNESDI